MKTQHSHKGRKEGGRKGRREGEREKKEGKKERKEKKEKGFIGQKPTENVSRHLLWYFRGSFSQPSPWLLAPLSSAGLDSGAFSKRTRQKGDFKLVGKKMTVAQSCSQPG